MSTIDYWIRRSPFFEGARRAGCSRYSFANHMYQPAGFAGQDALSAYWHLVNGVTLWDVGTERQVEITGPDAFAFTNALTPRDLTASRVGRCSYTLITSKEGGIVNDPVLLRLGENHFWLSTSDTDLLLWVKGVAVHSGLDVHVGEPDVSPVQIQGPKSPGVMDALFGGRVVLAPYQFVQTDLDGIPVIVSRTGWSGEVGYEIFLRDHRFGDALWDRVLAAGKPFQIAVTGPSDANRVEAGILGYRSDFDMQTNPFEAGLDRFVNLDAPADFIGKAALWKVREQGITRKLVGIRILGVLAEAQDEYRLCDGPIGHAAQDTRLAIEAPWGPAAALVSAVPFIKRQ